MHPRSPAVFSAFSSSYLASVSGASCMVWSSPQPKATLRNPKHPHRRSTSTFKLLLHLRIIVRLWRAAACQRHNHETRPHLFAPRSVLPDLDSFRRPITKRTLLRQIHSPAAL